MRRKSIKKNYLYNVAYQLLTVFTPFITTPYISRILGAEKIGIVSYSESIVAFFSLFAILGINTYGQREISYVQDQKDIRSEVFWSTKILQVMTSLISLICYMIFALFQDDKRIFLVFSLNLLSILFDITWFFQGMEEFGKIAKRNIVIRIVSVIFIFLFVKRPEDYIIYVFGLSSATLSGNLMLWLNMPKYVYPIQKCHLSPFKRVLTVLTLFLPTIAIQIYTVFDKTMIGMITHDSFQNGYYEQAMKIIRIALMFFSSMGAVIIPRVGFYFYNNKLDQVEALLYRSYRFVWMFSIPMCIGLIMISRLFVPWFYGSGFDEVIPLLCILSVLFIAIGINSVTGMQYLVPIGKQNIFTITVIAGAVINFILNLILIPLYKALGAAIASVVAESFIAILQIYIVRKELLPKKIILEGVNYFTSGLIMLIVLIRVTKDVKETFEGTIITVIIGITVYLLMLIVLKDEFFISNYKNIEYTIKEKIKGIAK